MSPVDNVEQAEEYREMSRHWQIGSRDDALSYYICAPTQAEAIKQLEALTGPQNPSRRVVKELPAAPEELYE